MKLSTTDIVAGAFTGLGSGAFVIGSGFAWGLWGTALSAGLILFLNGWFMTLRRTR